MTKANTPLWKGDALESARVVCVLTHGRGQSPEAMEDHVLRRLHAPQVAFVMPRAATGSWYDAKAVDPLTDKTREQLSESLAELSAIVAELPEDKPVVMAGFSQGACLSIEYAMAFGSWSGALVAFTGCRVGLASDERPKTDVTGLPVYLTGSDADPWIPVGAFAQSVLELATLRARLRADVFPLRGHEVSDAEIAVFQHTLQSYSQGPGMPW